MLRMITMNLSMIIFSRSAIEKMNLNARILFTILTVLN